MSLSRFCLLYEGRECIDAWFEKLYETFIETQYYKMLIEGFRNTVIITLGALLIGVVIGTLIAVIKYFAEVPRRCVLCGAV